jgi:hypothetical protein
LSERDVKKTDVEWRLESAHVAGGRRGTRLMAGWPERGFTKIA